MILDLYTQRNFITINVKLIHVVGLQGAVYLAELLTISEKAWKKNKLVDGKYLFLDREYIYSRTSLTIEDQLRIDNDLMKIDLIKKNGAGQDYIYLNAELLTKILISEEVDLLKSLSDTLQSKTPAKMMQAKKETQIDALKRCVVCSNVELAKKLYEWVDSTSRKSGLLSKAVIQKFQESLNNYTKGDLDMALAIVDIATIQGYRDCKWAINIYERDNRIVRNRFDNYVSSPKSAPKTTEQQKADKLADIEF